MTIEFTDQEVQVLLQILKTYPLTGNFEQMAQSTSTIALLMDKLMPKPKEVEKPKK